MAFERIAVDPAKMGGMPCIRGLRIPVASVVDMVAAGLSVDEIIADFPELEREDIAEALRPQSENQPDSVDN
jgi:uncharacterized protein (DUF433 family)